MEDRNLHELLARVWGLEDTVIAPVSSGTSSDAILVTAGGDSYILRKLRSSLQGHWEYEIASALSDLDIAPRIIQGLSGEPFAEENGSFYNLQAYISGQRLKGCDESMLKFVAVSVARMHSALSKLPCQDPLPDRFALSGQLDRDKWEVLIPSEIKACFPALLALDAEKEQWIHGDLGSWNLLCEDGNIKIIDFGECRLGSVYFDVAAVLTSLLSNIDQPFVCAEYIRQFIRTYEKNYISLECGKLFAYIQLWYVRGILANTTQENYQAGKSEKMIGYFLDQMTRFQEIQSYM